ncbi:CCAAT enhancer-binding gamma [Brachionus plicatilis]|uniref:CCAAT enhancer-binding gamma n=1 Tax=Brachionus plicatilis TaxID=10195 RepID=A0A3M7RXS1_BRAPC|nr:CCAAT enhancer-binding gamma [Brachionus plicatilis]
MMNNDLDTYCPKTASSETDYTNLFRGLSTFELPSLDRLPSFSEVKKENQNRGLEDHASQEKTYTDLSDLVIQEQMKQDHDNIKYPVQVGHILTNSNINNQYIFGDESSMSSESSYATSSALSTIENTGFKDRNVVKRLNTVKPVPLQSGVVEKPKRGRKPTPLNADPNVKLTKKQLMMKNAEKPVVCFGNKVVEKNTDEYAKRRDANNAAVKKCRQKSLEKQKEREDRMRNLSEENQRLNETVKKLCQELDVLKNIIIQMSPDKKLPANIAMMYKEVES